MSVNVKEVNEINRKVFSTTENIMQNLYMRWLDEKDYEDIADYGNVVKPLVEKQNATFVKMTKRPFGFIIAVHGVKFAYSMNLTEYKYKHIKQS